MILFHSSICHTFCPLLLLHTVSSIFIIIHRSLPSQATILGDGLSCFPILRSSVNSSKMRSNDALMSELKSIVTEQNTGIDEQTVVGRTLLGDVEFLQKLAEQQSKIIRILSQNLVLNIPKYREVVDGYDERREVMKETMTMMMRKDDDDGKEEKRMEEEEEEEEGGGGKRKEGEGDTCPPLLTEEMSEKGEENQQKTERDEEGYAHYLDLAVWKQPKEDRSNTILGRIQKEWRRHTRYEVRKAASLVKGLRDTGKKRFTRQWREGRRVKALVGLITYYANPWHCHGLQKSIRGIASFFQSEQKRSADNYRQKGKVLFKLFCRLNLIDYYKLESISVADHLNNPDQLDADLAVLEKFTLGAMLIPFKQRALFNSNSPNLIRHEHLQLLKAVMTERQLLEALIGRATKKRTKKMEEDSRRKRKEEGEEDRRKRKEEGEEDRRKRKEEGEELIKKGAEREEHNPAEGNSGSGNGGRRRRRRKRVVAISVALSGAVTPSMSFAGIGVSAGTIGVVTGGLALTILTILAAIYLCNI